MNPLNTTAPLPLFGEIRPEHVEDAIRARLDEARLELDAIELRLNEGDEPTYDGLVARIDRAAERLTLPWGTVGHLMAVKNSAALREAYEKMQPAVVELSMRFGQSRPVFKGLQAIRAHDDWHTLTPTQQRIVELSIRDAKLAGVALEGKKKERFNEIALELSKLQTDFSNHVLDATKAYELVLTERADIEGLPESVVGLLVAASNEANRSATAEKGPWTVTLAYPSFVGFMKHSPRRDLREKLYRAYVTRASDGDIDNTPLLDRILSLRSEKAKLLGYDTFAALSLATKMAPEIDSIFTLLEELRVASYDAAVRDVEDMKALAAKSDLPEATDFRPWDFHYWSERLREARFDVREEEVRQFFPMSRVLEGLFAVAKDLFGVTIREAKNRPSVWHDDVRFY
ncbi:MAG: M3 family metallopeptidase, partial [Myxococcota bacterium]